MKDLFDIPGIARRARLAIRKVRYVIDQRILPGMRGRLSKERAGRPRAFTQAEGYFIAIAAVLLEGGVQRGTVIELMARLADMPWPPPGATAPPPSALQRVVPRPRTAAEALYRAPGPSASLHVGDGTNLRLRLRGADTGWIEPRSLARLEESYRPWVVIQLDSDSLYAAFEFPQEPTPRGDGGPTKGSPS